MKARTTWAAWLTSSPAAISLVALIWKKPEMSVSLSFTFTFLGMFSLLFGYQEKGLSSSRNTAYVTSTLQESMLLGKRA